jgi:hypothetical protein
VVAAVLISVLPEVVVLEVAETELLLPRTPVAERVTPEVAAAALEVVANSVVLVVPVL